jgi:alkane 1-monooxygenase
MRPLLFLVPFVFYALALFSFQYNGLYSWIPVAYAFVFIPLFELIIKPSRRNLEKVEEELAAKNPIYDIILYLAVALQYYSLWIFLNMFQQGEYMTPSDIAGHILAMGILCGVFGINVGHELGHRRKKSEQILARVMLLSSLYMHFFIEHNKGHHTHVATDEDPASAEKGLSIYAFWPRAIIGTHIKAWRIASREAAQKGIRLPFIFNEMLLYDLLQIAFVLTLYYFFGSFVLICFLASALIGMLLLEGVNYIEHYGLRRERRDEGYYERVKAHHSWNSNHILGRLTLFELTRHSDHHYQASRKYQILRDIEGSPQMPTGYPGTLLLTLIPPIWFRVMDKKIEGYGL